MKTQAMLLTVLLASAVALSRLDAQTESWDGQWISDAGVLDLTQNGRSVSGTLDGNSAVNGTIAGNQLTINYPRGQQTTQAVVEIGDDGLTFSGERSDGGKVRGWRADPDAESQPAADFSGIWLTSSGTMLLEQDGERVSGPYGAQGWSSIEGTVKGRRLDFEWKRIQWSGPAWFEMTADGKRLFGATTGNNVSAWTGIRADGFSHHVEPQAGEVVKGYTDNGMLYLLRMPDEWTPGEPVDVIVLLHGSNWTTAGMVHVTAGNWPHLAKKFAILGIQGENWASWSDIDDLRFNYTYVNWVGRSTLKGFPYTDRESPFLVAGLLDELGSLHQFARIFLGGHSQGGFLTYVMHMHYPEKLAGTFPVAGGMIVQAEPDAFDDEALIQAQRDTPMVIVHGQKDNVVEFSTGQYVHNRLLGHDFHRVKLLSPDLGHPWDFLPIGDAIDWLDAMTTDDEARLLEYTNELVAKKQWREVGVAIERAKTIGAGREFSPIWRAYEDAAKQEAGRQLQAIQFRRNNRWVDGFLAWYDQFAFSRAGEAAVAEWRTLQAEHTPPADELYAAARKAFNNRDRETGMANYREIVDKYYASPRYRTLREVVKNDP